MEFCNECQLSAEATQFHGKHMNWKSTCTTQQTGSNHLPTWTSTLRVSRPIVYSLIGLAFLTLTSGAPASHERTTYCFQRNSDPVEQIDCMRRKFFAQMILPEFHDRFVDVLVSFNHNYMNLYSFFPKNYIYSLGHVLIDLIINPVKNPYCGLNHP